MSSNAKKFVRIFFLKNTCKHPTEKSVFSRLPFEIISLNNYDTVTSKSKSQNESIQTT